MTINANQHGLQALHCGAPSIQLCTELRNPDLLCLQNMERTVNVWVSLLGAGCDDEIFVLCQGQYLVKSFRDAGWQMV